MADEKKWTTDILRFQEFYQNVLTPEIKAQEQAEIENPELFLSMINTVLAADPDNGYYYHLRGGIYREMGKAEPALADFTRAISLGMDLKTTAEAYKERGGCYEYDLDKDVEAMADYQKAIELFRKSLKLFPDSADEINASIEGLELYMALEVDPAPIQAAPPPPAQAAPPVQTVPAGDAVCPSCGAALPPGAKFCANCGTPVPAAPQKKFCSNCGAQLKAGAKYCSECGTPAGA
jgi:tetratricopeptide (TPR) repeat protein